MFQKLTRNTQLKKAAAIFMLFAFIAQPLALTLPTAAFAIAVVEDEPTTNATGAISYDKKVITPTSTIAKSGALGNASFAAGNEVNATGDYSTAFGWGNTANASGAFTAGGVGLSYSGGKEVEVSNLNIASGRNAVAMGEGSWATGIDSFAMGYEANASGYASTSMGYMTNASGNSSTAMGVMTNASNYASTAMGSGTNASGNYSTAMGNMTTASGDDSTAMGNMTTASGAVSTAMGYGTYANGYGSFAGGFGLDETTWENAPTRALGTSSFAFGTGVTSGAGHEDDGEWVSDAGYTFAVGYNTSAVANYAVAMGKDANAAAENSFAFGGTVDAAHTGSVALGYGSVTNDSNQISVGNGADIFRRIVNVADGTADNDSATFGQLKGYSTITVGGKSMNSSTGITLEAGSGVTLAAGASNNITISATGGGGSVDFAKASKYNSTGTEPVIAADTATSGGATAVGYNTGATGNYSTAVGWGASASGEHAVALGASGAQGNYSFATGWGNTANASGAFTAGGVGFDEDGNEISNPNTASGRNAVAFGEGSYAKGDDSFAMGYMTTASGESSTAMGSGTNAASNYSFATGFGNTANGSGAFTAGGVKLDGTMNANTASGRNAVALGEGTNASGIDSFAGGGMGDTALRTTAYGEGSFAYGGGVQSGGTATWNEEEQKWIYEKTDSQYTVAMGYMTNASGNYSTSLGERTDASGATSTAMGYRTNASGDYSTAMGYMTTASAYSSTAMGSETTASGDSSTAMGFGTNASGDYSTAMGGETTASGYASTAMGYMTTASVGFSTAMGYMTTALGYASTAIGYMTTASGEGSFAGGYAWDNVTSKEAPTRALGRSSFAFGTGVTSGAGHEEDGWWVSDAGYTFAAGYNTSAVADYAVAMGNSSGAYGNSSVAMGSSQAGAENVKYEGVVRTTMVWVEDPTEGWIEKEVTLKDKSPTTAEATGGHYATATGNSGAYGNYSTAQGKSTAGYMYQKEDGTTYETIELKLNDWGEPYIDPETSEVATKTTTNKNYNTYTIGGEYATASGKDAKAYGNYSVAMGNGAQTGKVVKKAGSTGDYEIKGGESAVAMGNMVTASGDYSVAMGSQTNASGNMSTAMGDNTTALGDYSTAMGVNTTASGGYSTAMGHNTIASGDYSTAMGDKVIASGDYSTSMGYYTTALGNMSTATGYGASAKGAGSFAGGYAWDTGHPGARTRALGESSFAFGDKVTSGAGHDKDGEWVSDAGYTFAAGYNTSAVANYAVAMGKDANAAAANSFAFGGVVTGTATNSVALGQGSSVAVGAKNSVALGANSVASAANEISVGKAGDGGFTRKITNVTAGDLTDTSHDVVIGSQLNATNKDVATNAANIETNKGNITTLQGYFTNGAANKAIADSYGTTINASSYATKTELGAKADQTTVNGTYNAATYANNKLTLTKVNGDKTELTIAAGGEGSDTLAVHYDKVEGTRQNSITLQGVATVDKVAIKNVADGVADSDAATYGQVKLKANAADVYTKTAADAAFAAKSIETNVSTLEGYFETGTGVAKEAAKATKDSYGTTINASSYAKSADVASTYATKTALDGKADTTIVNGTYNAASYSDNKLKLTKVDGTIDEVTIASGGEGSDTLAVHYDKVEGTRQNSITLQGVATGDKVAISNVAAQTLAENGTYAATTGQVYNATLSSVSLGADKKTLTVAENGTSKTVDLSGLETTQGTDNATAISTHTADKDIHVTVAEKTEWSGKQAALTKTQLAAVNSGITTEGVAQIATNAGNITTLQGYFNAQGKALNAVAAETAVKATQDGDGAVIADTYAKSADVASTYATKTELGNETDRAKAAEAVKVSKKDGSIITSNLTSASGIEIAAGDNIELSTSGNKLTIKALGGTDAEAVHYSNTEKSAIALEGTGGTAISNVKAKELAADGTYAATTGQVYNATLSSVSLGADKKTLTVAENGTSKTVDLSGLETTQGTDNATAISTHTADKDIHVTVAEKTEWSGKQEALTKTQLAAVNSGITTDGVAQIATNAGNITTLQGYFTEGKANEAIKAAQDGNGAVIADTYATKAAVGTVTNGSYVSADSTIAANINALDTQVHTNATDIGTLNTRAVKYDKYVTAAGLNGNGNRITNVAASGAVDTNAVNYSEIKGLIKTVNFNSGTGALTQTTEGGATSTVGKLSDYKVTAVTPRTDTSTGTEKYYLDFTATDKYSGETSSFSTDMTNYLNKTTIYGDTADIENGKNIAFGIETNGGGKKIVKVNMKDDISLKTATFMNQEGEASEAANKARIGYVANSSTEAGYGYVDVTDGSSTSQMRAGKISVTDAQHTSLLSTSGLTVGDKTFIDTANADGNYINANSGKIVNVKAGDITSASKDAVNGSQLYAEQEARTEAIQTINDSAVMQSGINATKVAQIATNAENITANAAAIAKETTRATKAEETLQGNITAEAETRVAAVTGATLKKVTLASDNKTLTVAENGTSKSVDLSGLVTTQGTANAAAIQKINDSAVMKSGITAEKVGNYDSHVANDDIHVTAEQKTAWSNKAEKSYVDTAKQDAIDSSKSYTDMKANSTLKDAKSYAEGQAATALKDANSYTDTKADSTLKDAKSYSDSNLKTAKGYTDEKATGTLADAKIYTDSASTVKVGGDNVNSGSGINFVAGSSNVTITGDKKTGTITIDAVGATDTQAVHYDTDAKDSVTLGGTSATAPVALKNAALVANSDNEFTFLDKSGTTAEKVTLKNVAIESTSPATPGTSGSSAEVADGSITQVTEVVTSTGTETKTVEIKGGDVLISELADETKGGVKYVTNESVTTNLVTLDKQVTMIDAEKTQTVGEDYKGKAAVATAVGSTAVGYSSNVSGGSSTAVGYNNIVTGANSTAVGTGHKVYADNAGAFGDPITIEAGADGSYVMGNNVTVKTGATNTFVLGGSTDEANPTVVTSKNSVILGTGSNAKGDNEVSVGNADTGLTRRITNVADGQYATDAATVGQVASVDQKVTNMQQQVAQNTQETREVGAMSAALAGLHYVEPSGEGDDKFTGAVAYGGFRGESAAALGVAYKPSPNLMVSASTSVGNSQNMYNAGVAFKFGPGKTVNRAALQKQVKYLNDKLEKVSSENAELKGSNAELKQENAQMKETLKNVLDRLEKLEKKR